MGKRRSRRALALGAVAVACAAAMALAGRTGQEGVQDRDITIRARQYGYTPHRVTVGTGDRIRLRLVSLDVVHGLYLEGHDLEAEVRPGKIDFRVRRPSQGGEFQDAKEVIFTAGPPGKYRYRCSVTCGTLHPFMQGEFIVQPNVPFRAGAVGAFGIAAAAFALMLTRPRRGEGGNPGGGLRWRLDLLESSRWLKRAVMQRWFQFAVVVPNVLILFFFVIAGFFGSPIGNRNIIVTIVWIFWWFILITLMVPLGGRLWCMVCPLPFLGEWFARRRLVGVRPEAETSDSLRTGSLNRRWPRRFSNIWLQNLLFLSMCTMSTILVTRPALTAAVLGGMLLTAVAVHALYRRRSFCRYLCPLNAWMSLYSMTAISEVRPRQEETCTQCREKSCATGSSRGWGCPWLVNPSRLRRNNYCGLCLECLKACPNGNLTVRVRPFASDLSIKRLDEAWMAFIMIALVVAYSVTLLGPWSLVKEWANVTETGNWQGFAVHSALVWLAALVVVPGLWYLSACLGRPLSGSGSVSVRDLFTRYSYMLVPLGLLAWMAFSLPLIMVNYSHITSSLSDPLGWGWDLFGTADKHWEPLKPEWVPYLQVPLLLAGLWISLARGSVIARGLVPGQGAAARSLIPHGALCTGITIVLLKLYAG